MRHVNRKGKRLACEKHLDWWPASTKPILQRYAIENSVQLLHCQRKGLIWHQLPSFLNGDVAQMVERSLSMREVRRWMPCISNLSEQPRNQKRNIRKLNCLTKKSHWYVRPIRKRKHLKQYRACWESDWWPEPPRFTSQRRRRKHYSTDKWIKDIPLT